MQSFVLPYGKILHTARRSFLSKSKFDEAYDKDSFMGWFAPLNFVVNFFVSLVDGSQKNTDKARDQVNDKVSLTGESIPHHCRNS